MEGYYDAIHPSVLLASLVLENHIRDGRESIPNLNFYITPLETDPGTISTDCGHIIKPTQVNFQLAKTWLKNCVDNHGGACARNPWVEDSAAATEIWVIDVIDQCIRSIANSERFIALSYVWGGYTPRPLARNLVDYLDRLSQPLSLQKSIPKLPKTIRDAIYTVKNIGERYLWVDSLCIPPDPAIKADQINNMDQVYGSALLTIIAADGINSNAGLSGVLPKSRSLYQIEQKITPHLRLAVILPIPMRRVSETIWNHRGWTFQERFLSKRLLTFTSGQIIWQCNSNTLFEDVGLELKPGGDRFDDLRRISIKPPHTSRRNQMGSDSIKETPSVQLNEWERLFHEEYVWIVKEYTQRSLTNSADILAAFAGVSRVFEKASSTRMLYGLPEGDFDAALLWTPASASESHIHSLCRRASSNGFMMPTWSWAGWDRPSEYPAQNYHRTFSARWFAVNKTSEDFYPINGDGRGCWKWANPPQPLALLEDDGPESLIHRPPHDIPTKAHYLWFYTCCTRANPFFSHWEVDSMDHKIGGRRQSVKFYDSQFRQSGIAKMLGYEEYLPDQIHLVIIAQVNISGVASGLFSNRQEAYTVMLVTWDKVGMVASRVGLGHISVAAWLEKESEWRGVILG